MLLKIKFSVAILMGLLLFNGCTKEAETPDFSQPVIDQYVGKATLNVGGGPITTGPLKDLTVR
jgi:hypothetical protein